MFIFKYANTSQLNIFRNWFIAHDIKEYPKDTILHD